MATGFRWESHNKTLHLSLILFLIVIIQCTDALYHLPENSTVNIVLRPKWLFPHNEYCWHNSCTVGPHIDKRGYGAHAPFSISGAELEVKCDEQVSLLFYEIYWRCCKQQIHYFVTIYMCITLLQTTLTAESYYESPSSCSPSDCDRHRIFDPLCFSQLSCNIWSLHLTHPWAVCSHCVVPGDPIQILNQWCGHGHWLRLTKDTCFWFGENRAPVGNLWILKEHGNST